MAVPVIMPKQGQSVETCIITQWVKNKGETVKKGDVLFSYETDKASFDAEAEEEGILLDVFYQEGDEVPVLSNVAAIGIKGEDVGLFRPRIPESTETEILSSGSPDKNVSFEPLPPAPESPDAELKLRISPRARVMAAKLGLNTSGMQGSGPNGRIIARDIEARAKDVNITVPADETDQRTGYKVPAATKDYKAAPGAGYEDIKLTNVRKLIGRSMHESITTSAQLTHHMSADVRRLLAIRKRVKSKLAEGSTVDITLNDMVCYAAIRALEIFPELNSHFLGTHIRTFSKVHLGIAVDTPRGLMVPVAQNASDLSLQGLSNRLSNIADQCRKGSINPELIASSAASFTVSNLGNYGVEMFTPIINLPQVAILGVNTITYRPADTGDGTIGFVPVMGLSLTYDHRAVDGGPATLFLKEIKNQIENFDQKIS